jgi:signal transduction histidine kinase
MMHKWLSPLTSWVLLSATWFGMAAHTTGYCAAVPAQQLGEPTALGVDLDGRHGSAYPHGGTPARYAFRVSPLNENGVGTSAAGVPYLQVAWAFLRGTRFWLLCVAISPVIVISSYLIMWKQLQVRHRQRLRTRYLERERVARDLHDTLLQGIQALLFRLQDWQADPALPDALRAEVAGVIGQAVATVVEGRQCILNLRGRQSTPTDLVSDLSSVGQGEVEGTDTEFQLRVQGRRRSLTMDAKRQLFDIGREAIRNAHKHAEAKCISVRVEFKWRTLRLEVVDDGRGFDPFACERQEGHFGLLGMRERATELHGTLSITRVSNGGTSVAVVVPAATTFSDGFFWVSRECLNT